MSETSTKPYLLRALYEWCTENGFTPYIVVVVDAYTRVPVEFVKNGEIVLNISFEATGNLKMDNDLITFKARFGGISREIEIPVENVSAIYARENGQGMAFEVKRGEGATTIAPAAASPSLKEPKPTPLAAVTPTAAGDGDSGDDEPPPQKGGRPRLTRIK
ncbi:MAG: ClpXP protease specificity-enhancing factor [Burkholderiaceae bacterium]